MGESTGFGSGADGPGEASGGAGVSGGSVVSGGAGTAIVVSTGTRTALGAIRALAQDAEPPRTRMQEELDGLGPEVRDWEPRAAVVGEGTTEGVARAALSVLGAGGALVLETAGGRAQQVAELLRELGYEDVRVTDDLTGLSRVADGVTPS